MKDDLVPGQHVHYYLVVYRHIKKKANGSLLITHKDLMDVLGRDLFRVKKSLFYPIIKDLEYHKLLKKIDRLKYEIVGGNADSLLNQYNYPI